MTPSSTYHYEVRGKNYDDRTIAKVNGQGVAFGKVVAQVWDEDRLELEQLIHLANAALAQGSSGRRYRRHDDH